MLKIVVGRKDPSPGESIVLVCLPEEVDREVAGLHREGYGTTVTGVNNPDMDIESFVRAELKREGSTTELRTLLRAVADKAYETGQKAELGELRWR